MDRRTFMNLGTAGVAAFLSVPLAALAFVAQSALGGTADVALGVVFTAMLGTHLLIGVGEGILTALVVSAVMASRADVVYGAPRQEWPSSRSVS